MELIIKAKLNPVHSKLDWQLKRGEKIFQEAVRVWFAFTLKQIQTDLRTKFQKDIVSELTDWEYLQQQGQEILKPATLSTMQTGGGESYKLFQVRAAFSVLNPEAVKAAEKFTADLVRQVNSETKKGIRTFISAGIKEGKAMDKIARELRPLVGLTQNQTQSIMNYRTLLGDKEKFPKLTSADIDRKVQRYADKTHRRRAQTISRTETARAQTIGYVQGMEDLGVEQLEFSASSGCCDECAAMNGEKYSISEAKGIIPVHPNCRCALLPVVDDKAISNIEEAREAIPEHIDNLLEAEKTADIREAQKIGSTLRKLGYKGGLKGKPPVIRPPTVEPSVLVPKPKKEFS